MKYLLSLLMLVLCATAYCQGGAGGAVIAVEVDSKEALIALRERVNGGGCQSYAVTITSDIDLRGENWTPIGLNSDTPFVGSVDGGGHTITNLTIKRDVNNQGLFGYIKQGDIHDLTMANYRVEGANHTGAICGLIEAGSIVGCSVHDGSVVGSNDYVGGVVGSAYVMASISRCSNSGSVVGGGFYVGGVVGNCGSSVRECSNSGTVSGVSEVGGVVGYGYYITDCYNKGVVTNSNNYVGGVAGKCFAYIARCKNEGIVSARAYVGGVLGYAYYESYMVSKCENSGSVSGSGNYVGGVVGYAYSALSTCSNSGDVKGVEAIGGVIGKSSSAYFDVVKCSNQGKVSGDTKVGGVVGYAEFSTIKGCKNQAPTPENLVGELYHAKVE